MDTQRLIQAAREARLKAYCPYSGFSVGASLQTGDGAIFTGCNIENASYGLTVCAERVAIYKAVSEGKRDLRILCLCSNGPVFPCGACLQVMAEFNKDLLVVVCDEKGQYKQYNLNELLPRCFSLDLEGN